MLHITVERFFHTDVVYTERPVTVVIRPSNESIVRAGDKVSCSVVDNVPLAGNYTWIDSATGNVIHDGAEWTIKPCSLQSCINTAADICLNSTHRMLMLQCHVTVAMTTARGAVALVLEESKTSCNTDAMSNS